MYKNPYQNLENGEWLKTNFHTHAGTGKGTCGSNSIEDVLDIYKNLNYNALCISNHDLYTDTQSFANRGMYLIQGVEYSKEPHMLTIGVNHSMHDLPHQQVINETNKEGGFTILCHPNWIHKEYWKWEEIDKLSGFVGIEIINMLIYRLSGSGLATDTWDYLLSQGKLIYGFGNDDFHLVSDAGRSYNLIYASKSNFTDIKQAVKNGCFVASTGLCLKYLNLINDEITIEAVFPTNTYIDKFNYKFIAENGKVIATSYGKNAKYKLKNEMYMRVEVIAENGAMLFTQPIYNKDLF